MLKKINIFLTFVLIGCICFLLFTVYKLNKEESVTHLLKIGRGYKTTFESYYSPVIPQGYVAFQGRIIFKDGKKPIYKKENNQDVYAYPNMEVELRFPKESMRAAGNGRINPNQMWISTVGRFKKQPENAEIIFSNPGYEKVICKVPLYDNYTVLPDIVFVKSNETK